MDTNGRPQLDYTHKDYASLRDAMLALASEKLPTWTDHSPNDLGIVLLELFAFMGDQLFYYQDRIANESYLDTAVERRSVLNLLRLIGYELRPPQSASVDLTLLFALDAPSPVQIDTGTQFQTAAGVTGTPVNFAYLRKSLTLNLGMLQKKIHTDNKTYWVLDKLPAVQINARINAEILGSSTGESAQRFPLASTPLIDETLVVTIDEGAGPQVWQQQRTLLHSGSADPHFIVRRDENNIPYIEFGDNQYGKIPRRGRNNIRADYFTGGGPKGNVPSRSITKAVTPIAGLAFLYNDKEASGGAEAESAAEGAARGPELYRSMGRAVTTGDYEVLAREFGVGKARARAGAWNRVDLFVAPAGGGMPSDTLKDDLRAYFEDKRILTSFVEIHDPVPKLVYIKGQLEVEAYFYTEQVQQRVEAGVSTLLAFDRVDFGDRLYVSKIYEVIESIDGVRSVNISHFTLNDPARTGLEQDLPLNGSLRFDWNELPVAGYTKGISLDSVTGGRRAN